MAFWQVLVFNDAFIILVEFEIVKKGNNVFTVVKLNWGELCSLNFIGPFHMSASKVNLTGTSSILIFITHLKRTS